MVPIRIVLWGLGTTVVLAVQLLIHSSIFLVPALTSSDASTPTSLAPFYGTAAIPAILVGVLGMLMFKANARLHVEGYRWNYARILTLVTFHTTLYSALLHVARTTSVVAIAILIVVTVLAIRGFPTVRSQLGAFQRNLRVVIALAAMSTSLSGANQVSFQDYLRNAPGSRVVLKASGAHQFDRYSKVPMTQR